MIDIMWSLTYGSNCTRAEQSHHIIYLLFEWHYKGYLRTHLWLLWHHFQEFTCFIRQNRKSEHCSLVPVMEENYIIDIVCVLPILCETWKDS